MSEEKKRFTPKREAGNRSTRDEGERPAWQQRVAVPKDPERAKSPLIPDEITAEELPLPVRVQLKTLTEENAERVARHLAMVGLLIDQDPELAHLHAMAAVARASRIGMVHEFAGATAYAIGDFALSLRELLTHRRISGSNENIAVIVDCERGLGRPDKALAEGRKVDRNKVSAEARVNLAIALSGARLDLNEPELALVELEIPELNPAKVFEYSAPLFSAYSECLAGLGRAKDSEKWAELAARAEKAFHKVGDSLEVLEEIEIPVRRERVEGEEFGDRPRRSFERTAGATDRTRRDGDRPRRDSDRPRSDGDRPRSDGDRPRRDGDRPRNDGDRTGGAQARPRPGGDGPRPDRGAARTFRKNDGNQRRNDDRPGKR